jgi:hypothetical protein
MTLVSTKLVVCFMVFKCHFQHYLSYIVVVSFIDEGNCGIWRKPPECRKSMTTLSHNVVLSTPRHEQGLQL